MSKPESCTTGIVIVTPMKAHVGSAVCLLGFTPALGFVFPSLFLALQGSTEDEQHMTKGTSLIESQHHHLLHCLEKTTVSTNTILLHLANALCLAQASYGQDVHTMWFEVALRHTQ